MSPTVHFTRYDRLCDKKRHKSHSKKTTTRPRTDGTPCQDQAFRLFSGAAEATAMCCLRFVAGLLSAVPPRDAVQSNRLAMGVNNSKLENLSVSKAFRYWAWVALHHSTARNLLIPAPAWRRNGSLTPGGFLARAPHPTVTRICTIAALLTQIPQHGSPRNAQGPGYFRVA